MMMPNSVTFLAGVPTSTNVGAKQLVQTDTTLATGAAEAKLNFDDYAGGLCIVCFDADKDTILAPCGHVAMCR